MSVDYQTAVDRMVDEGRSIVEAETLAAISQANRRGLSDNDRDMIERLCSTMTKPTPGKIALKISRDVGTVAWYMITNGLIERKIRYDGPTSYMQGGTLVFRYTEEHDKRIVSLRKEGQSCRAIAATVSREFGIARTGHSIDVRLKMLAAYEGGPEQ